MENVNIIDKFISFFNMLAANWEITVILVLLFVIAKQASDKRKLVNAIAYHADKPIHTMSEALKYMALLTADSISNLKNESAIFEHIEFTHNLDNQSPGARPITRYEHAIARRNEQLRKVMTVRSSIENISTSRDQENGMLRREAVLLNDRVANLESVVREFPDTIKKLAEGQIDSTNALEKVNKKLANLRIVKS